MMRLTRLRALRSPFFSPHARRGLQQCEQSNPLLPTESVRVASFTLVALLINSRRNYYPKMDRPAPMALLTIFKLNADTPRN